MKAILEREKSAQASDASHVTAMASNNLSSDEALDDDELLELAALNLDDPNWMSQLSANSISKFHRLIASGALDDVYHPWVPWWYRDVITPKIQIIEPEDSIEDDKDDFDENSVFSSEPAPSPPLMTNIPTIKSLTTVTPSPLLANHALEMMYAYTYTKRMFNGDWDEENSYDAVEMVIILSAVLRENSVYKDLKDALRRPLETSIHNSETFVSTPFSISVLHDVLRIVSNGHLFLVAAFSELHDTFMAVTRQETEKTAPRAKPKVTLSQMQKKLLFMTAWANECSKEILPALQAGVQLVMSEYQQIPSEQPPMTKDDSLVSNMTETKPKPKQGPKIEVIS